MAPSAENFFREIFFIPPCLAGARWVSLVRVGYRWIPFLSWDVVTPALQRRGEEPPETSMVP